VDNPSVQGGTVTNNGDGTIDYQPLLDFNGFDIFTYTIEDNFGIPAVGTVNVTINQVPDPPVATTDSTNTAEDTLLDNFDVIANDSDVDFPDDFLQVIGVDNPSVQGGSVINNGDGTIDYLAPLNFNGADSFNYTLQDSFGLTVNGTVNITVDSVNDVPTANDDVFDEVLKDILTILPVLLNDNDVESPSLTVLSVNTTGTLGSVVNNGNTVSYTSPLNSTGADSFTYIATDGTDPSNVATVSITVIEPPSLAIYVSSGTTDAIQVK